MTQANFEAGRLTRPARQQSSSKIRLEFSVPAEDCDLAAGAIECMDVEATIYDSESCGGKKRKDTMDANMGRDVMKSKRPRRRTIISIVEAEKAGSIIAAVASAASSCGSSVIKSPVSGIKTQ